MIVRRVSYSRRSGTDWEGWLKANASAMRSVTGMRKVEFLQSVSNPEETTALMYFDSQQALDDYKTSGLYQELVESLTSELLDTSKPVTEEIFTVLDM
jgi:quinol monooxygenase YgiN